MGEIYKNCAECEPLIVNELEQKLISAAINWKEKYGKVIFKMGRREHRGKIYEIYITVKEANNG